MKVPLTKELVIRDEDKVVEYKEKEILRKEKDEKNSLQTKRQTHKNNKLAIYEAALKREEFSRKETKEIVLDEDEYLNYLEEIIQKDYFPVLYELKKEKVKFNFLNQLIHNNLERAQSVTGNRVENTNVRDNLDQINKDYFEDKKLDKREENKKKPQVDVTKQNVDSFCMKYSSEELESLRDIFYKDNQNRLQKYFWMYEQEHKANEKLKAIKDYSNHYLALPDPCKNYSEPNLITAEIDAKNSLFFLPDYSNTNNRMTLLKDDEGSKENSSENNQDQFDKFSKNITNEKGVSKENTRLPQNFIETLINKHSHKLRKKIYESYENSDVIKLLKELKELDSKAREEKLSSVTPMINGYKILKDPELNAEQIQKIPIFTWGEIAGTPNVLENRNEPKFIIPQTPDREYLAHNLANKSLSIKRQREDLIKKTKNNHQTVRSNMKNYELTPSAMKLLNTVKRNTTSSSIFHETNSIRTPLPVKNKNSKSTDLRSIVSNISIKSVKK